MNREFVITGALYGVTPAQAGVHSSTAGAAEKWIPAFAGMTRGCGMTSGYRRVER